MTDKSRLRIEIGLIALLFGAGAGWGAFQFQLNDLAADVKEVKERVAAMYCGSLPPEKQVGCR